MLKLLFKAHLRSKHSQATFYKKKCLILYSVIEQSVPLIHCETVFHFIYQSNNNLLVNCTNLIKTRLMKEIYNLKFKANIANKYVSMYIHIHLYL